LCHVQSLRFCNVNVEIFLCLDSTYNPYPSEYHSVEPRLFQYIHTANTCYKTPVRFHPIDRHNLERFDLRYLKNISLTRLYVTGVIQPLILCLTACINIQDAAKELILSKISSGSSLIGSFIMETATARTF
jgi:hypothetical protein